MRASMSAFLPAPPTMVVLSFSIETFLARPSMLSWTLSSLTPRSSEIAVLPGQDGDVLQCGLATVTEARRLHRCHHQATAQFVDDESCKRLALDVIGNAACPSSPPLRAAAAIPAGLRASSRKSGHRDPRA